MNDDKLFRQALQRQNDRAAGMKMPDDMEQRVMKSLQTLSNSKTLSNSPLKGEKPREVSVKEASPLRGGLVGSGRRLALGFVAVAACVLLLIMLNVGKQEPDGQTPVVAEEVTVPKDNMEETTQATAPEEVTEQPVAAQTAKPQPAKKRRKVRKPIQEETVPREAEPVQAEPEQENEYLPQHPDLYLMAVADARDIRSRGERLYQEVAQIINNSKNIER